MLQAEDGVATAETDLNISVVQIYRAFGGRWDLSNDSTTEGGLVMDHTHDDLLPVDESNFDRVVLGADGELQRIFVGDRSPREYRDGVDALVN